jgi:hypothetical protein
MSHQRQKTKLYLLVAATLISAVWARSVNADPLPGRDRLKFEQKPMIATTVPNANGTPGVYFGHDELSTGYRFPNSLQPTPGYQGQYMADDFADKISSPIVHLKWWGSYAHDLINPLMPVNQFLIAFESDVPATAANGFSHPGQVLSTQVVKRGALAPASGTFTEKLIRGPDPLLGESLYEYNAELNLGRAFPEKQDTVYWLKIAALVDVPGGITFPPTQPPTAVTQWGWHNRDYTIQDALASTPPAVVPGENNQGPFNGVPVWHFQDDAVSGAFRFEPSTSLLQQPVSMMSPQHYLDGIDGPPGVIAGTQGISRFSKDLAFAIYAIQIPEPATCLLTIIGLASVLTYRRRALRA